MAVTPAVAHHAPGGPHSGLSIPGLTHGAMKVVAAHREAILALADDQVVTDPTFRRLRNFVSLQHYACLYEVMPGSVTDEASPFNECAYAELAGVRTLLDHMESMTDAKPSARLLKTVIEGQLAAEGANLVLCGFSAEPFNTADVISPDWLMMPTHVPTVLTLLGMLMLIGFDAALVRRW